MDRRQPIRPKKTKAEQQRNKVAPLMCIRFAQKAAGGSAIPAQSTNHVTASGESRTLVLTGLPIGASFSGAQASGSFGYSPATSRKDLRTVRPPPMVSDLIDLANSETGY